MVQEPGASHMVSEASEPSTQAQALFPTWMSVPTPEHRGAGVWGTMFDLGTEGQCGPQAGEVGTLGYTQNDGS